MYLRGNHWLDPESRPPPLPLLCAGRTNIFPCESGAVVVSFLNGSGVIVGLFVPSCGYTVRGNAAGIYRLHRYETGGGGGSVRAVNVGLKSSIDERLNDK